MVIELEIVVSLLGALATWLGFIERRIQMLRSDLKEKIDDVNKINKVIQDSTTARLERLENKMDFIISLQLKAANNDKDNS